MQFILGFLTALVLAVLPATRRGKMEINCVGSEPCARVAGLNDELAIHKKINLVIVHGMGAGLNTDYTELTDTLAESLHLLPISATDEAIPGNPSGTSPARLFIRRYGLEDKTLELTVYELHWWPLIQHEKARLLADEKFYPGRRAAINRRLKQTLINERLADPIAYLNPKLGVAVRDSVHYTICRVVSGTWLLVPSPTCSGAKPPAPTTIITESLGSEIVFEALVEQGAPATSETGARTLLASTSSIFMLANQIPLLRLAGHQPKDPTAEGYLGSVARLWPVVPWGTVAKRQIIAVSDPSDLLSYPIPESISAANVSFVNVTCPLGRRFALGTVVNPLQAHTAAKHDSRILALIAFGSKDIPKRRQRARVTLPCAECAPPPVVPSTSG